MVGPVIEYICGQQRSASDPEFEITRHAFLHSCELSAKRAELQECSKNRHLEAVTESAARRRKNSEGPLEPHFPEN